MGRRFQPVIPEAFFKLFEDPAPGLMFHEWTNAGFPEFGVFVNHKLNDHPSNSALAELRKLDAEATIPELHEFYSTLDGADLCIRFNPQAKRTSR